MATDPGLPGGTDLPNPLKIPNTRLADSYTGTTSGADYLYAWTTVGGYYEIVNYTDVTTSSPMSNPNFPVYNRPTTVNITVEGTLGINVVNIVSGVDSSATPGHWNHDTSNVQGGLDVTGAITCLSAAEKFLLVTRSATEGKWVLPNGTTITAPAVYNTGQQGFSLMAAPGPWPAGIGANTSATMPAALLPMWADLGGILNSQGAAGVESLTDNWSPSPN